MFTSRALRFRLVAASVGMLAGLMPVAQAQNINTGLDRKVWMQLGVFRPTLDTQIRSDDDNGGLGSNIDGEDDLGLRDSKSIGTLLLGARLADRWRLEFEYFSLNRSASKTARSGTIRFGDTVYPASLELDSHFDSKVYRLSGGYSLVKTPQTELGVVAGVHVTDFSVGLNTMEVINGVNTRTRVEQRSRTLPLPTIGMYGNYAFAPNWEVSGRADVFSLNHGGYDGSLLNLQANLAYRFTPQVAVALGYRVNHYKISSDRSSWRGSVDYKFHGPQVVLDVGF
jgi:hypothetical protein